MMTRYHLEWGEGWLRSPRNGFPIIKPQFVLPKRMVAFDKIAKTDISNACVHFHLADRRIDRVWTDPDRYVPAFRKAACVATPDFSVLPEMDRADIIYNVSRSLRIGRHFQDLGINVLVTAMWANPDTYDVCFEAIPHNTILLVSSVGVNRRKSARSVFKKGLRALCDRTTPLGLVLYGPMPLVDFDIPVLCHFERSCPVSVGAYQPDFLIQH